MALYAAFCIGSLIYFSVLGNDHVRDCFISLAYLVVIPVFFMVEYFLDLRSPFAYTLFVLVFCVFCFLGASYNFYTYIPILDDILHACWGLLFATLGFSFIKSFLGEPKTIRQFVIYLVFSAGFCMILSIIWEIYEFACDSLMPAFDMQEDSIVDHFHSFMLHVPYDHLHTLQIDGIAYTQVYGEDNELLYTIEGGYLDIGLIDTMMDIIWCVVATCALSLVLSADRALGRKLYPHIIPVYIGKRGATGEICEQTSTESDTTEEETTEEGEGETSTEAEVAGGALSYKPAVEKDSLAERVEVTKSDEEQGADGESASGQAREGDKSDK